MTLGTKDTNRLGNGATRLLENNELRNWQTRKRGYQDTRRIRNDQTKGNKFLAQVSNQNSSIKQ